MKRAISLIVTLALVFSLTIPVMAASAIEGIHGSITMTIGGEEVTYTSFQVGNTVYVYYTQNGERHFVSHTKQADSVEIDDLMTGFLIPYAYSDGNWVEVAGSTIEGDIMTDVENILDGIDLMATLIAVIGGAGIVSLLPDADDILIGMVDKVISEQLPTIYYLRTTYYEVPIVSSRPNLGYIYEFYADEEMEYLLCVIDACV